MLLRTTVGATGPCRRCSPWIRWHFLNTNGSISSTITAQVRAKGVTVGGGKADNDKDPFGERRGWDAENLAYTKWDHIDTSAFMDALETKEVTQRHFGTEWARIGTYVKHAVAASTTSDKSSAAAKTESSKPVTAQYSEDQRIPEEMEDEDDVRSGGRDDEDDEPRAGVATKAPSSTGQSTGAFKSEPTATDPHIAAAIREAEAERNQTGGGMDAKSDEDREIIDGETGSGNSAAIDVRELELRGVSLDDPVNWNTEEVCAWLQHVCPKVTDADTLDAFRMSRVNGDVLLNKVLPCDLFREMRKWTRRKGNYEPKVDETLVRLTVQLCFPYCR